MKAAGGALAVLATLLVGGCGSHRDDADLERVKTLVDQRLPGAVTLHWNQGSDDDRAAEQAIRTLLGQDLDAAAAAQIALLNNRQLQAIYARLGIAQADLVQAGLLANPVFSGAMRVGSGGTSIELSVVQNFLSLLQRPLRKRLAEDALARATYEVAGAVIDLAATTRSAFYRHQGRLQVLELRRSVYAATSASFALADRLQAAGNITDLMLANERSLHEESRLALADAELDVQESREQLNELMGLWGPATATWKARERLDEPQAENLPGDDAESRAVAASLELLALRQEVIMSARAFGRMVPWWAEGADIGVSADHEPDSEWFVGPQVDVAIPIFDQGQGLKAAASAALEQDRQRFVALAVSVRTAARLTSSRMLVAFDRVQYFKKIVLPLQAQIVQQSQLQFNVMQVSAFELLEAKRHEIDAGVGYINALQEYWQSRTQFDRLLAGRRPQPMESEDTESGTSQSEGR